MPNLVSIACIVAQINAFIQTDKAKSTRLLMLSKKFYFTTSSARYIHIYKVIMHFSIIFLIVKGRLAKVIRVLLIHLIVN